MTNPDRVQLENALLEAQKEKVVAEISVLQKNAQEAKPLVERFGLWIGSIGTLITICLTLWNAHMANEIGEHEGIIKDRVTNIEESKERVERYKWVSSLLPLLIEKDTTKRNVTIALVRLALTKEEAEQVFSSFQLSSNQELRQAGQQGFESIENQELNRLILQINANSAEERKPAVAKLERDYSSSSVAVSLVLDLYSKERIQALSPSGVINGLYYLSVTDQQAWTHESIVTARSAITRILGRQAVGSQTKAAISKLEQLLDSFGK